MKKWSQNPPSIQAWTKHQNNNFSNSNHLKSSLNLWNNHPYIPNYPDPTRNNHNNSSSLALLACQPPICLRIHPQLIISTRQPAWTLLITHRHHSVRCKPSNQRLPMIRHQLICKSTGLVFRPVLKLGVKPLKKECKGCLTWAEMRDDWSVGWKDWFMLWLAYMSEGMFVCI